MKNGAFFVFQYTDLIQEFDHCVHVFAVIHRQKFTRDYLKNYNDSEHAVKTKNNPNFINFLLTKYANFGI
jgi:hypothetical protein